MNFGSTKNVSKHAKSIIILLEGQIAVMEISGVA